MTAIYYPDCESDSESGRYTLEARSPHNGTISHRDGRMPSEEEFAFKYREHQSEFRYRLLDNGPRDTQGRTLAATDPRVVWERFQEKPEDPPQELIVSDDGRAVIRTHGFAPEVIAVERDGQVALRVRLVGSHEADQDYARTGLVWALANLSYTTAGHFWSSNSWRGFFRHQDETYFAWRASWGQRLVLDMSRAVAFTDERLLPEGLAAAVLGAEREGVKDLMERLSRRMDEVRAALDRWTKGEEDDRGPLPDRVRRASSALHLIGVHQLRDCVAFLREWEGLDVPSSSTGSSAMPGRWWRQTQRFRPIVHHALKRLGEEPRGHPTYSFIAGEFTSPERFPMPEKLPDRRARATNLSRAMDASEVLRLLGSPDFIRRQSRKVGSLYQWSEVWEYDFRDGTNWTTLRMTWEEERRKGRMTAVEEVAPYWLDSDEREAEILGD